MAEEFGTDQLVEFCHRLGLAKDGYLDEKELAVVCNCLGLQAPEEMLKELFEELDTDKDGRVCLDELSQMLRGMSKNPPSPKKTYETTTLPLPPSSSHQKTSPFPKRAHDYSYANGSSPVGSCGDRYSLSILDPSNAGFTKVSSVLDMWLQWGVSSEEGAQILQDLGFPTNKASSLNVQDLARALEDEADNVKGSLPLVIHTSLLTYRSEMQYLRQICDSVEAERDKLRSDILEAHHRSSLLAQEVDEQATRAEKNNQISLQKMESKALERVQDLQEKFQLEKEALQQALQTAESQLKSVEGDDSKLKTQISKLNSDNALLQKEVQSLNVEINSLSRSKNQLEKEIERYVDVEQKLLEMERKTSELGQMAEAQLSQAHSEVQALRDQNDELANQLEVMREKVKTMRAHEKRSSKRRKGSSASVTGSGGSVHLNASGSMSLTDEIDVDMDDSDSNAPLEKIGRFHHLAIFGDEGEDLETSLASCSSHPDSGTFPVINLGLSMGETSTDSVGVEMDRDREMDTIMVSNDHKPCLQEELDQNKVEMTGPVNAETQTEPFTEESLLETIKNLEEERNDLKGQCSDLDSSLEALREEYEKCEDYWHDKLQEARNDYEQDRMSADEKFHDLLLKIKEYEDAYLQQSSAQSSPQRLPVIEERVSLEQQVTDLEDECEDLREKLKQKEDWERRAMDECNSLEAQVSHLTKKCHEYESRLSSLAEEERSNVEDSKMMDLLRDRIRHLEYQVHTLEETISLKYLNEIEDLKSKLVKQEEDEERLKTRSRSPSIKPRINSVSPIPTIQIPSQASQPLKADLKERSRSLLEMLQHPQKDVNGQGQASPTVSEPDEVPIAMSVSPYLIWPQRYANSNGGASLPFIPESGLNGGGSTPPLPRNGWSPSPPPPPSIHNQLQAFSDPWSIPPGKKAWCHVELGWLQAIRTRLKQREDQCHALQRALQNKEMETDRILAEMRYKHSTEVSNWEHVVLSLQNEQREKITQIQNLWIENGKLMAALSSQEQRVGQLEQVLKSWTTNQQQHLQVSVANKSPRSLPYPRFST